MHLYAFIVCTRTRSIALFFWFFCCSFQYGQRVIPQSNEFITSLTNNLHSIGISRAGEAPTKKKHYLHSFDHPALLGFSSQQGVVSNLLFGDLFLFLHANYTNPNWIKKKNQALQIHFSIGSAGEPKEQLESYIRTGLSWGISFSNTFAIGIKSNLIIYLNRFEGAILPAFGVGLDPSIHYSPKLPQSTSNILGIYELDIFFYTQNLNIFFPIQLSDFTIRVIPLSFHFGVSITFFRYHFIEWSTFFDLSFRTQPNNVLPLQIGTQLSINFIDLRFSFIQNFLDETSYKILASLGFEYQDEKRKLSFDFGVSLPNLPSTEVYFSAANSFFFSQLDTTPPRATIKLSSPYIASKSKLQQNFIVWHLNIHDASPLKYWKLSIYDNSMKLIKVFQSNQNAERKIPNNTSSDENVSPQIITTFFKPDSPLFVPKKIIWDTTIPYTQAKLTQNIKPSSVHLQDGSYFYRFEVKDQHNNITTIPIQSFIIDNQPPQVQLKVPSEQYFFADYKSSYPISINFPSQTDLNHITFLTCQLINQAGKIIQTLYTYKKSDLLQTIKPKIKLRLNLQDIKSLRDEPQMYSIQIKVKDYAGNQNEVKSSPIFVSSQPLSNFLFVYNTQKGFSPNQDNYHDTISFNLFHKIEKLKQQSTIFIYKKIITTKSPTEIILDTKKILYSQNILPQQKEFIWDGTFNQYKKNQKRKIKYASNGIYQAVLCTHRNKTLLCSKANNFYVLSKSAAVDVKAHQYIYSPDLTHKQYFQIFQIIKKINTPIYSTELSIYEEVLWNYQKKYQLVKTFQFKEKCPNKIYWNGIKKDATLIQSATKYVYQLTIKDIYGNTHTSKIKYFYSGILLLAKQTHLKASIHNIFFSPNNAQLEKPLLWRLQSLVNILERYPQYSIKLEVHSSIKGYKTNRLKETELQAFQIAHYLKNHGIKEGNIHYQGFGEIFPLEQEETNYLSSSKNIRLNIVLSQNQKAHTIQN